MLARLTVVAALAALVGAQAASSARVDPGWGTQRSFTVGVARVAALLPPPPPMVVPRPPPPPPPGGFTFGPPPPITGPPPPQPVCTPTICLLP